MKSTYELDALAGTWSDEEARAMEMWLCAFGQIDEDM
jgi:hypothetical protein